MCLERIRDKIRFNSRKIYLDRCLIPRIKQINECSLFKTIASCCGHGKLAPTIIVRDFQNKMCFEYFTKRMIENRHKNGKLRKRFYKFNKSLGVFQLNKDIINENSLFIDDMR